MFDLHCSYLVICCIPDPRAFVLFNSALSCLLFSRVQMKMSILKRGLHETITIDLLVCGAKVKECYLTMQIFKEIYFLSLWYNLCSKNTQRATQATPELTIWIETSPIQIFEYYRFLNKTKHAKQKYLQWWKHWWSILRFFQSTTWRRSALEFIPCGQNMKWELLWGHSRARQQ